MEDRYYHRRTLFEQGRRQLAVQRAVPRLAQGPGLPAELLICVAFALFADAVSRLFGWLRVFAYLSFLVAIADGAYGAVGFGGHHWAFDLIYAAYLLRSFGRLIKREWSS